MFEDWGGRKEGQKRGIISEHGETLGGDRYVHFIDCNDGFLGVYICQNIPRCIL